MQRKHKRKGGKEIFCVLLCIVMIVGTAFSAAAQSADGENAEFSPAAPSGAEEQQNAGNPGNGDPDAVQEQEQTSEAGEQTAVPSETENGTDSTTAEKNMENGNSEGYEKEETGSALTDGENNGVPEESGEDFDDNTEEDTGDSDRDEENTEDPDFFLMEDEEESGEEDSEYDISWYSATQTSFVISSPKELAGLTYLVNKGVTTFSRCTVTLAGDIDLAGIDWEPVGFSSSYSFAGTFDGSGYTIRNLSVDRAENYIGLFGYLRGTVQNLCLENAVVVSEGPASASSTRTGTGAVAGYCSAGGFSNLKIRADVSLKNASVSSETWIGGVAGYCAGNSEAVRMEGSVTVENLSSSAAVYAGGVIGFTEGELSDIVNGADVSVSESSSDGLFAGGAAGYLTGGELLLNCGNTGDISVTVSGPVSAGGLAGETDVPEVKNCFNQGSVQASAGSFDACVGGLFGQMGDGSLYNCYSSNSQISGSSAYRGYLVGNVTGSGTTSCSYVYWPGNAMYNSTAIYGSMGKALSAATNCMGISRIASSRNSTLTAYLNTRSLADYDEEASDNLYMWSLPEGSTDNDPPVFREEALYPVYPTAPVLSVEQSDISLHAQAAEEEDGAAGEDTGESAGSGRENGEDTDGGAPEQESDSDSTAVLRVSVENSDSTVTMQYQWQKLSENGENYLNVPGEESQSQSLTVSAGEPGVEYYRLKVECQASWADAAKTLYSDPIAVTTGWRISFADGGMADGSGAVAGAVLPEALFPVLPGNIGKDSDDADEAGGGENGSGEESSEQEENNNILTLGRAESAGKYFLGWTEDYEEGKVYSSGDLLTEYDTSELDGDVTLYAIFREAGTVTVTLNKGAEDAQLKEGAEPEDLMMTADEGTDFVIPDGDDYFVYEGYRFMGWQLTAAPADSAEDPEGSDETAETPGKSDSKDGGSETGNLYLPGDTYTAGADDITLTAVWSRLYQVTFDTGVSYEGSSETGGVQGDLPEAFQAVEGESITLPSADGLTYEGYLFSRWKITWTDAEGQENTSYVYAGRTWTMPAADITVSAQWGEKLTVTFHDKFDYETDAVVTGEIPETIECLAGSSITLPECTLERTGYVFTGWYESAYDYVYQPGEQMNVSWNVDCYPVWTLEHEVVFRCGTVDNGGVITGEEPEPILVAEGYSITLPENTFIPPDAGEGYYYRFVGWQLFGSSGVYGAGTSYTASSKLRQITFTAVWKRTVIWTGEIAEEFGAGSGTADDPYQIATAGELAKMYDDIKYKNVSYDNTYFVLVDDIDLNSMVWTPIGVDEKRPFEGYFDGGGHTISSLLVDSIDDQYAGLFGYADGAEITDLNLESVEIETNYTAISSKDVELCTGAVVGRLDDGFLSGCTVSGSVRGNVIVSAGTGETSFSGYFCGMTGGIAGAIGEGTIVENCRNSASIGGECVMAGGIVGYADDSDSHPALISGCYNSGTIHNTFVVDCAGGIVGRISFGDIEDCVNEGEVWSSYFSAFLGGIAALAGGTVSGCTNSGEISVKAPNSGLVYYPFNPMHEMRGLEDRNLEKFSSYFYTNAAVAGGITAFYSGESMEKCTNLGSVLTDYESDNWGSGYGDVPGIAGGIVGILHGAEVTDCLNSADVTAINRTTKLFQNSTDWFRRPCIAGGIVGDIMMDSVVSYCCMTGTVKSTGGRTDGYNAIYKGTILGSVHGTDYSTYDGQATLISCYAKADSAENTETVDSFFKEYAELKNVSNKTEEQFVSGQVAYLLGYSGLTEDENGISEESGGRTDRGAWTQSGRAPSLGRPSVVPVSVSEEKIDGTITLGNAYCSGLDAIYAVPGSTVYISADVNDKTQSVTERVETEEAEGGTWYYTYEDTEADTFKQLLVLYADTSGGSEEEEVTGQSFVLQSCSSAVVSALVDKDIVSTLISSEFVPDEEEEVPQEPEEPSTPNNNRGSGGGSGGGSGSGTGTESGGGTGPTEGVPGGTNPTGGSNPTGGTDPNGIPGGTSAISLPTLSSRPTSSDLTTVMVPAVNTPASSEEAQAESAEPPAPESGGGGETEEAEEIPEESAEEPAEDLTIFEVVQNTIQSNPLTVLLLLAVVAALIAVGGYSRYKKERKDNWTFKEK